LNHPNIKKLLHFFVGDDLSILVYRFIPTTLLAYLKAYGKLMEASGKPKCPDILEVEIISAQLVLVLEYLRARGVVHNDVRLENILVDNGNADVLAFCLQMCDDHLRKVDDAWKKPEYQKRYKSIFDGERMKSAAAGTDSIRIYLTDFGSAANVDVSASKKGRASLTYYGGASDNHPHSQAIGGRAASIETDWYKLGVCVTEMLLGNDEYWEVVAPFLEQRRVDHPDEKDVITRMHATLDAATTLIEAVRKKFPDAGVASFLELLLVKDLKIDFEQVVKHRWLQRAFKVLGLRSEYSGTRA